MNVLPTSPGGPSFLKVNLYLMRIEPMRTCVSPSDLTASPTPQSAGSLVIGFGRLVSAFLSWEAFSIGLRFIKFPLAFVDLRSVVVARRNLVPSESPR